ncbi:hypothetical protein GLAREA_07875 [Glarea lozoyensis ATCC 20868]|uniref:Uncharacterized protein n=1 Tax=Glarea lozoyensis (strain ATCC 20868 / MF5171) TaxID=1116229 RepID=S3DL17_GLAL2|nr:uncharacterized protein GLAREA_07875 [Glarea lozoyensis ATCC 20868]EPE32741.1 hypothetical protein GLAREA_07875 [Glarea lozoyensis ATCC 20868]
MAPKISSTPDSNETNPPSPAPTEYYTPSSTFNDPPSPTPSEQLQDEFTISTLFPTGSTTPTSSPSPTFSEMSAVLDESSTPATESTWDDGTSHTTSNALADQVSMEDFPTPMSEFLGGLSSGSETVTDVEFAGVEYEGTLMAISKTEGGGSIDSDRSSRTILSTETAVKSETFEHEMNLEEEINNLEASEITQFLPLLEQSNHYTNPSLTPNTEMELDSSASLNNVYPIPWPWDPAAPPNFEFDVPQDRNFTIQNDLQDLNVARVHIQNVISSFDMPPFNSSNAAEMVVRAKIARILRVLEVGMQGLIEVCNMGESDVGRSLESAIGERCDEVREAIERVERSIVRVLGGEDDVDG